MQNAKLKPRQLHKYQLFIACFFVEEELSPFFLKYLTDFLSLIVFNIPIVKLPKKMGTLYINMFEIRQIILTQLSFYI